MRIFCWAMAVDMEGAAGSGRGRGGTWIVEVLVRLGSPQGEEPEGAGIERHPPRSG